VRTNILPSAVWYIEPLEAVDYKIPRARHGGQFDRALKQSIITLIVKGCHSYLFKTNPSCNSDGCRRPSIRHFTIRANLIGIRRRTFQPNVSTCISSASGVILQTFLANRIRLVKVSWTDQCIMSFGGLRGAIAFALSALLEKEVYKSRDLMITATIVVVYFTNLILVSI